MTIKQADMAIPERAAQEIQRAFDESRGFDVLPFSSSMPIEPQSDERLLRQLEYVALGLAEESGEFVGLVKKWRRGKMLDEDHRPRLNDMAWELADLYIYTIKAAALLGLDLGQIHAEKVARNMLRFAPRKVEKIKSQTISIVGAPGSGKTSVVELLRARKPSQAAFYIENYQLNPQLNDSVDINGFEADASQIWFLDQLSRFIETLPASGTVIFDQDPGAIALVYSARFLAEKQIDTTTYKAHLARVIALQEHMDRRSTARRFFLLEAPVEILHKRCAAKPGRTPSRQELEDLSLRFSDLYGSLPGTIRIDNSGTSVADVAERIAGMPDGPFEADPNRESLIGRLRK